MGISKKQYGRERTKVKAKIAQLEIDCRRDPLKKNKAIHEELAKLKKDLESE